MTFQTAPLAGKNIRAAIVQILVLASIALASSIGAAQSEPPGALRIASPENGPGSYTLSDGVLNTAGTCVGPNGTFEQLGGIHAVAGDLEVAGGVVLSGGGTAYAFYNLNDGWVFSDSIHIAVAVFSQSGGTNQTGDLIIGPHNAQCTFNLNGGRLETINTTLQGSWLGGVRHNGGTHVVSNRLSIVGDAYYQPVYRLSAGELEAGEIAISHGTFQHDGGIVSAQTVILENGIWETRSPEQCVGALHIVGADSISTLRLPIEAAVFRFADSSAAPWEAGAKLIIENWKGSLSGGGSAQIFFGNSAAGLTSAQLAQVWFKDPNGCPPGLYPARMLATGELAPGPFLQTIAEGKQMSLQWEEGYVLQSSVSIAGPFIDVAGAVSPFNQNCEEGQRFYRLRKLENGNVSGTIVAN